MLDQPKTPIANFENLRVEFETKDGTVVGVEDVSFDINAGETVCVVGESGCGKSGSSLSMMRSSLAADVLRVANLNLTEKILVWLTSQRWISR